MTRDRSQAPAHAAAAESIDVVARHLEEMAQLHVAADRANAALLGYGWWVRIIRTSLAVRELHDDGFEHEASPLVRTILQHAAALVWLANRPTQAVEAIVWEHRDRTKQLFEGARAREWDLGAIALPKRPKQGHGKKPVEPSDVKYLRGFEKLCNSFGLRNLYVPYMIESGFVHPSANSADAYLEPAGPDGLPVLRTTAHVEGVALRTTALFLGIATSALAQLVEDAELTAVASKVGQLLGHDVTAPRRAKHSRGARTPDTNASG